MRSAERIRRGAIALALAGLAAALTAAPAGAVTKLPAFEFGSSGAQGGQFSQARGIAVNETGAGGVDPGTLYVAELGNNRISSFDADGDFIRAWGWDVVSGGETGFEVCEVAEDCKAGSGGEGEGQFASSGLAGGVAVDQETGDVYAIDRGNARVQQFSATGSFIRAWGSQGSGAGEFEFGTLAIAGIATDAAGNVYVPDTNNARIQKFDADGTPLRVAGWNVVAMGPNDDPEGGYEICVPAEGDVCKAGEFGEGSGQFGSTGANNSSVPGYLAASPAGDLYVVGRTDGTIYRLGPDLEFLGDFPQTASSTNNPNRNALAVDPGSGHVFFAVRAPIAAGDTDNIYELDPASGEVVDSNPAGASEWVGLAIDGQSGRMYGTRTTSATSVQVFAPAFALTVQKAGDGLGTVTSEPEGIDCGLDCEEASAKFAEGQTVTLTAEPSLAADFIGWGGGGCDAEPSPTECEVELTEDRTVVAEFELVPVPFEGLETLEAWPVADDFATLRAQLNPNATPTEYRFEYVEEETWEVSGFDEAQETPVQTVGGLGLKTVTARVEGLDPDTAYRYRVVAENDAPAAGEGEAVSFTTYPPPPPQEPRAFELVTTADKHGADATFAQVGLFMVAASGGKVIWNDAFTQVNPIPTNGFTSSYVGIRVEDEGWKVENVLPPSVADGNSQTSLRGASVNLSSTVVATKTGDPETGRRIGGDIWLSRHPGSSVAEIAPTPEQEPRYARATDDGSHAYVADDEALTPAAESPNLVAAANKVQIWTEAGGVVIAPLDGDGDPVNPCGASFAGYSSDSLWTPDVTEDGKIALLAPDEDLTTSNQNANRNCWFGGEGATQPAYVQDLYLRDNRGSTDPGQAVSLNLSRPPGANPNFGARFVGMSEDGTVVFLASESRLTSDDPDEGPGNADLYRWDASREVDEVQRLSVSGESGSFTITVPAGSAYGTRQSGSGEITDVRIASGELRVGSSVQGTGIINSPATTIAAIGTEPEGFRTITLSQAATSGSPPNNTRLVASDTTAPLDHDASAQEIEDALNALPAIAGGGSVSVEPDGPGEFLISFDGGPLAGTNRARLEAEATGGVSASVEPEVVGGPITRISAPEPGGEASAGVSDPNSQGIERSPAIAASDGEHVYFLACGRLIPGEGRSCAENSVGGDTQRTRNLYLWSEGEGLRYITNVRTGARPEGSRSFLRSPLDPRLASVTPDGGHLVFGTLSHLSPGHVADAAQLYWYSAALDRIDCVSCAPSGMPPSVAAHAAFRSDLGNISTILNSRPGVSTDQQGGLSSDGSTVIFATREGLLSPSESGLKRIWEWRNGRLSPITPVDYEKQAGSVLIGTSADASEVYFSTRLRLVGSDGDGAVDVYVAKVGGGFPEPPPPSPCEGEACRSAGSVAPPGIGPGSAAFEGPGNRLESRQDCRPISRRAQRQRRGAGRLRRRARALRRVAVRSASAQRARAMRRRARRLAGLARRRQRAAKRAADRARRCTRASARAADADHGGGK